MTAIAATQRTRTVLVRPDASPEETRVSQLILKLRNEHIIYPRDDELRAKLGVLIEQIWIPKSADLPLERGNRNEQDILIVTGPTGAGKTYSTEKALRALKAKYCLPGERIEQRIKYVKFPGSFSTLELARRILAALNIEVNPEKLPNEIAMWIAVHGALEAQGILAIHFDEFQRFATVKTVSRAGKDDEFERFAEKINDLLTAEWPVALIISGMPEANDFFTLKAMEQVGRRRHEVTFNHMSNAEARTLGAALSRYCKAADLELKLPPDYNVIGRLRKTSFNTLGYALELAQEAVVNAVRRGSRELEQQDFVAMYYQHWHVPSDSNLFHSEDWPKIPHKQEKRKLADLDEVQERRRKAANAAT